MSAQKITINTDALQEHARAVRNLAQNLDSAQTRTYDLRENQGDAKDILALFEESMTRITELSRELLQGYINVVQAAHGEYVGADSELARQFNPIE